MSGENLELVRRHYKAWNSGDTAAVLDGFAEDIEWHGHPRLPEPGPYHTREEVGRWMSQFQEAWGELSADPVELIDAGDTVVVLVHMTGRGRGSGVEVRGGVDAHVVSFEDGKASYFRILPGDMVIEGIGLDESEAELLVLRVQEGLALPEIAKRMGIDESEAQATFDGALGKVRRIPSIEPVT